jgi:hypothetical protein
LAGIHECADESGSYFGHDGIPKYFNRVSFHLDGYPIDRQYTPEITRQDCPSVSKRVAIDGVWRERAARKAFEVLMSLPSLAAGVGQPE